MGNEPFDWYDDVHRALRRLPNLRAPHTLLPRVMAAIAEREAAARTWFTRPLAWQVASVAALVVLGAGIALVWPNAHAIVSTAMSSGPATYVRNHFAHAVDSIVTASSVTSIIWDAFLQPIVGYLLAWIVLRSAACAGFAAALGRVALGGASHS